jgi:hypothetical protein
MLKLVIMILLQTCLVPTKPDTFHCLHFYITDAKKNIRAFVENSAQNAITSRITSSLQSAFGI